MLNRIAFFHSSPITWLSFLIVFLLFFASCKKEIDIFIPDPSEPSEDAGLVIASSGGVITGGGGEELVATVRFGDVAVQTDANGVFLLQEVSVPSNTAFLKVEQEAHFDAYRVFKTNADARAMQSVSLSVLPQPYYAFGSTENTWDIGQTGQLQVPADAFTDLSGADFQNEYQCFLRWVEDWSSFSAESLPAMLLGAAEDGSLQYIQPSGMLLLEVQDMAGIPLLLKANSPIMARFPNTSGLTSGTKVPLWSLDQETGLWRLHSEATVEGDQMLAQMDALTYYLLGVPNSITSLQTILENEAGQPVPNLKWQLNDLTAGVPLQSGITNATGLIQAWIPKEHSIELTIKDDCNDPVYTDNLGVFSHQTALMPIQVPTSLPIQVQGSIVDCVGEAIPFGYVKVQYQTAFSILFADAGGQFQGRISDCGQSELMLYPADLLSQEVGDPLLVTTTSNLNVGSLPVCQNLNVFINFDLDGEAIFADNPSGYVLDGFTYIQDSLANIRLAIPDTLAGTYDLQLEQTQIVGYDSSNIINAALTTTVTYLGPVGDFIIGTFGGNFQDNQGMNHTVSGSYKVERE